MPDTDPHGDGWERWRGQTSEQLKTLISMHRDTRTDIGKIHDRIDSHASEDAAEFKRINAKLNWFSGVAAVIGTVAGWLIPGGRQ